MKEEFNYWDRYDKKREKELLEDQAPIKQNEAEDYI
jgi:hypothetical protein